MVINPLDSLRRDFNRIGKALGIEEQGIGRKYYKIYIPVESASVTVGSIYWKSAKFRFNNSFIETTYLESGPTPRVAALKYIYSLPQSGRIPSRVYAENIRDQADSGTFYSEELRKEIVEKIKLGGLKLLKKDW